MAKPFDNVFKEIIQDSALDFIQAYLNDKFDNLEEIETDPKPTELVQTVVAADFVYKISQNKEPKILHLEVQTKDNEQEPMHQRMLFYVALLHKKYNLSVKQVVLYLGENPSKMIDTIKMDYFTFKYKLISIKDIEYELFLKNKETLPLAILGKYGSKSALEVIKDIFNHATNFLKTGGEFIKLKTFLVVLGKLRKFGKKAKDTENLISSIKDIQFMFKDIDYTDVSIYQEGKLEGKLDDARAMLADKLPIAQIVKYTGLSIEQIEAVLQKLNTNK